MNKDIRNLLVITAAFAVVVGGLLIRANTGFGVAGNSYLLYAAGWLIAGLLAQLFAAGLPPSDEMLRDAMNDGDLAGLRVLLAARNKISVTSFPAYTTKIAASHSRCQGDIDSVRRSGKLTAPGNR